MSTRIWVSTSPTRSMRSTRRPSIFVWRSFRGPISAPPKRRSRCTRCWTCGATSRASSTCRMASCTTFTRSTPAFARAGSAAPGGGGNLRHGPGPCRFRPAPCAAPGRSLLRHPRQIEHGCSSGLFRRRRPHDRYHLRSNHRAGRPLHHPALPRTPAAHPLPGRRNGKEAGVPHQPVRVAGRDHLRALQKPLASRTVLQMDQAASADQAVLRDIRKCREDPNFDRRLGLRPRRHRQEAASPGRLALHIATDPFGHPVLAKAIITQRTGSFDPTTDRDRYQEALQELIEAKMKGLTVKPREIAAPPPVIDLMTALKRSLAPEAGSKHTAPKKAPDRRQPARLLARSRGSETESTDRRRAHH